MIYIKDNNLIDFFHALGSSSAHMGCLWKRSWFSQVRRILFFLIEMVYKTEFQFVIVEGGSAYTILKVEACSKVVYILSFLNSIQWFSLQWKLSFKFWQAEVQIGFIYAGTTRRQDSISSHMHSTVVACLQLRDSPCNCVHLFAPTWMASTLRG